MAMLSCADRADGAEFAVVLLRCTALLVQAELVKAQEEAAALREGSSDVVTLQAQLAAAQEEASGLRSNSEEVEYLQAQLRRTLRQVVELQRQVGPGEGGGRVGLDVEWLCGLQLVNACGSACDIGAPCVCCDVLCCAGAAAAAGALL
jgi:hypothetical protein